MKISIRRHFALITIGAIVSLGSSGRAAALLVFDAVNNVHSTPFGTESYGWSSTLGGAFVQDNFNYTLSGVLPSWTPLGASVPWPGVRYNPSSSSLALSTGIIDPLSFSLHPGQSGENAIVRVSPSFLGTSQMISLTGSFWGQDTAGTTTDVHILKNGISIFDGVVNGFGPSSNVPFALTLTVNPGDNLDFAVGFGNGNFSKDSTGLVANWSVVPEPSSVLLLGLTGAAALRRRRKQALA